MQCSILYIQGYEEKEKKKIQRVKILHAWVFFNPTKQVTSSVCLVPNTGERAMFFTSHPPTYLPKLDDRG
jgi:hypothetical protein